MSNEQAFYWIYYGIMSFVVCVLGGITFWAKKLEQESTKPEPPKELLYL